MCDPHGACERTRAGSGRKNLNTHFGRDDSFRFLFKSALEMTSVDHRGPENERTFASGINNRILARITVKY